MRGTQNAAERGVEHQLAFTWCPAMWPPLACRSYRQAGGDASNGSQPRAHVVFQRSPHAAPYLFDFAQPHLQTYHGVRGWLAADNALSAWNDMIAGVRLCDREERRGEETRGE